VGRVEELRESTVFPSRFLLSQLQLDESARAADSQRFDCRLLPSPGELLEEIFQRRIGDGSSVVGDRRGRHYGDHFQDLFLCEAGSEERVEFLIAQVPAFLNAL
jgi:hypothetical protein